MPPNLTNSLLGAISLRFASIRDFHKKNGNMQQLIMIRIARYKQFKDFSKRIMVATDIFGRGIDVERVNIVINYDMPDSPDSYLHRVGRAGRFGTKGLAITFVSSVEDSTVLNKYGLFFLLIMYSVQARFEVNIAPLPAKIDVSSYSIYNLTVSGCIKGLIKIWF